jgi:hypothetical protein
VYSLVLLFFAQLSHTPGYVNRNNSLCFVAAFQRTQRVTTSNALPMQGIDVKEVKMSRNKRMSQAHAN